ncbi:MAG: CvpA family protein [Firmicutes bacterium]|jgi:uncharacterized membrane protein required for colicin V production|nr:CvpA family protein [Bacillota bacterium]MBR3374285.1 CvpA family protein [Bacillota bacterium]
MKMDIAVILIFALTIFFTMRKGFVSTIAGFLKGIASVAAAYFLAGPLGKFIEGTSVGAATEFRISEQLSSRLGSSEAYNSLPGIFREGVDSISSGFIAETAADINHVAWIVLSFVLIIIVIRIVLGLLVNMVKSSRDKEGFTGTVDWILGLIIGVVIGLFTVFLFLALLFPVASIVAPGHSQEIMLWFDGSFFSQDLYDNNLLLLIFTGIFS